MRFDNDTLKNRYQTCRSYLEKRCEALPGQIERKFKTSHVIMNHPDVTA